MVILDPLSPAEPSFGANFIDGLRAKFLGVNVLRLEGDIHDCVMGFPDASFINFLPHSCTQLWFRTPALNAPCMEIYVSLKLLLRQENCSGYLAVRLNKRGCGIFQQHILVRGSHLPRRQVVRIGRGTEIIDSAEAGDVFEFVYFISTNRRPEVLFTCLLQYPTLIMCH